MDDTSLMDCSSDDVDYDIPLSLRIHMKKQAGPSPDNPSAGFSRGTSGETQERKSWSSETQERKSWSSGSLSERSTSPGLADQDASERGGLRERGIPLSEVINMISSSPTTTSSKKPTDKHRWVPLGSAGKVQEKDGIGKVGHNSKRMADPDMHSVDAKRTHSGLELNGVSERYNHQHSSGFAQNSSTKFSSSIFHRSSSSGSDHQDSQRPVRPFKITSPTKKTFHAGASSSSSHRDLDIESFTGQSRLKEKDAAGSSRSFNPADDHSSPMYSSMHVSWNKDGRKQTSVLDSPRTPSRSPIRSPIKQGSFWSRRTNSPAKRVEAQSPILIPDTPSPYQPSVFQRKWEQSDRNKYKADMQRSPTFARKDSLKNNGKDNVLLNNLLGEESEGTGSGSERRNILTRDEQTKKTSLSPILSAYAKRMSGRSDDTQTSPATDKDPGMNQVQSAKQRPNGFHDKKQNQLGQTFDVRKYSPQKDPVWDFAIEKRNSPVKANRTSQSRFGDNHLERSSKNRDGRGRSSKLDDTSPSLKYRGHLSPSSKSPSPIFSRIRQGLSSSNNLSPPGQMSPFLMRSKIGRDRDDLHTSPVRSKTGRDRDDLHTSPVRSVVGKVDPKERIWNSPGSGERGGNGSREFHMLLSRDRDDKNSEREERDHTKHGGQHKWKRKTERMNALLGLLSSDEEDNGVPLGSRKRKVEQDASDRETASEAAMKRMKTNSPHGSPVAKHRDAMAGKHRDAMAGKHGKSRKDRISPSSVHSKLTSSITAADPGRVASSSYSVQTSPSNKTQKNCKGKKSASADAVTSSTSGKSKRNAGLSTRSKSPSPDEATSKRSLHTSKSRTQRSSPVGATSHVSSSSPTSVPSLSLRPSASSQPSSSRGAIKKEAPGPSGSSGIAPVPAPENEAISIIVDNSDDDDVVVIDSFNYAASLVDTYSKKRKSHKKKKSHKEKNDSPSHLPSTSRAGASGGVSQARDSVSPSTLQMFNQLDEDEAMARRLQEEFDAEMAHSVHNAGERMNTGQETSGPPLPSVSISRPTPVQPPAVTMNFPANSPVRIGNINWNINFQPASALLGYHGDDEEAAPRRRGRGRNVDRHENEWMVRVMEDIDERYHTPSFLHLMQDEMEIPDLATAQRPHGRQRRGRGRRGRRNVDEHDGHRAAEGNDYEALLQLADRLGPAVDKRLTQASIERLPTFSYHPAKDRTPGGGDDESSCPICMDEYVEGAVMRRLPCFHGYHKNCIDMWLKKNQNPLCPICRVEVRVE